MKYETLPTPPEETLYVANGDTAGALSFFTTPKTTVVKTKYNDLRSRNLPFTLKSWSFVEDSIYLLAVEEIENGFKIDRYHDSSHAYQNNLGEEIMYQGLGL